MRFLLGALIGLFLFGCVSTNPQVVSLKRDFGEFADQKKITPNAELFRKNYKIFERVVYKEIPDDGKVKERKVQLIKYISANDHNADGILDAFDKLEDTASDEIAKYKEIFPDADYNFKIYLVPSLFAFLARSGFIGDRSVAVTFGADQIAKTRQNVAILFGHEVFHGIHYKTLAINRAQLEEMQADPISHLWLEGFACYGDALVNDMKSDPLAVIYKEGRNCGTDKSAMTREFIDDVGDHARFKPELQDKWFGAGDSSKGIPPMAAQCIGLAVVRELAKTYEVQKMLTWNPESKRHEIVRTLSSLARPEPE